MSMFLRCRMNHQWEVIPSDLFPATLYPLVCPECGLDTTDPQGLQTAPLALDPLIPLSLVVTLPFRGSSRFGGLPGLRSAERSRSWRHGSCVQGSPAWARSVCGAQGAASRRPGRPGIASAFPSGSQGDRPVAPSQHRADLRHRRSRFAALFLAGVRGRRQPGSEATRPATNRPGKPS